MTERVNNSLVTLKPSDSLLTISLHPLVLLTASDLVTRHNVRQEKGPVAGILLGQQKGQETTAEHAFAANLISEGANWIMNQAWTQDRIQQFKDVHKAPALEAVGWFALAPTTGPLPEHVIIQKQFETLFNDNAIFLAIHSSGIRVSDDANQRLPLTIYESVLESEDTSMQIDGEENTNLRFRELPYSIETDETEMIAIDYVAKGAGSAAAVEGTNTLTSSTAAEHDVKGKGRADATIGDTLASGRVEETSILTVEEEDQIAGITTRLNSVKMLQTRLQILSKFVHSLPASYISDQTISLTQNAPDPAHLSHLRNIQALLTRLSLLTPSSKSVSPDQQLSVPDPLQAATRSQFNDVSLISMLSQLDQDVQVLGELGRKFAQVEQGKSGRGKKSGGTGTGGYGSLDESDGRVGGFTVRDNMLV